MKKQISFRSAGGALRFVVLLAVAGSLALLGCGQVSEQEAQHRERVAAGGASYQAYCAGCHGQTGTGDGPSAQFMTIPPADLTQISKRHGGTFPEEQIYRRIDGAAEPDTVGAAKMPHWGNVWRGMNPTRQEQEVTDRRIHEMVAFLQSIQQE